MTALLNYSQSGITFGVANSARVQAVALQVSLLDFGFALGLVLVIALAGGLLPALRAARLEPAEALRK